MRTVLICVWLAMVLGAGSASCDGFGAIEARVVKPLAPDLTLAVGGGISVSLGEIPENVPVVHGRMLFGDFIWVPGGVAAGASISLKKLECDDHLRLGTALWRGDGFRWSVYLARAIDFEW
jgi:hypothetical protein